MDSLYHVAFVPCIVISSPADKFISILYRMWSAPTHTHTHTDTHTHIHTHTHTERERERERERESQRANHSIGEQRTKALG